MPRTALSRGRRPPPKPAPKPTYTRRTPVEIDLAADQLALAAALCGIVQGDQIICPWGCEIKPGRKTVKLVSDKKYIKCFKCGQYKGAINLVADTLGVPFYQAVDLLTGKDTPEKLSPAAAAKLAEARSRATDVMQMSFAAELSERTVKAYNAVLASKHASLAIAQKYYGQWHISPEAVATVGFVYITDPDALARELVSDHGIEAIVASGLAKLLEDGDRDNTGTGLRWMFSANYPVVEPQLDPKGRCFAMQFRPSNAQKRKVLAHKADPDKHKYVPPFMSLRGATGEHLIGINLEHLCSIPPTRVDIVEGAKDVAADLTLGNEAFGMPGTGVPPPKKSIDALRRAGHTLRVCMDGDTAGVASQDKVLEHFVAHGFPAERITKHRMPAGKDVTDILVEHVERASKQ